MRQKILITSALPYANGMLHFGHLAGAYLPADCYARFQRLQGHEVLYVCGSDEYGVAITLSAELAGRTPKEHIDLYHHLNKQLFSQLNFSFDHFSRTSWEGHRTTTQQFFLELLHNGYIEERVTQQLYSKADKKFLADRYIVGTCPKCRYDAARGDECQKCGAAYEATDLIQPRSKLSNAPLTLKPTTHWFLLLDKFKEKLSTWLDQKEWKANVLNFVKHYVDDLRPRAITRDLDWGIPVPLPEAAGKVLYVWFDAPIGYISATREWAELQNTPDRWRDFWCDPTTKLVQFIGKDNIPFHAVIFPAMIMGQNQPYKLVDELPANEFLNLEGKRFSKSENWTIDLQEALSRYTADQIRYTLAANAPETQDADFTWKDFQQRCNGDLLGKYGNFANRVLTFAQMHCNQQVPPKVLEETDTIFLSECQRLTQEISESYETFKLRRASQLIMEIAQTGNVYFDAKQPWKTIKQTENRSAAQTTIACSLECLKILALASSPIIPTAAQQLWKLLSQPGELAKMHWDHVFSSPLIPGTNLPPPTILFKKIEDDQMEQETESLKQTPVSPSYSPLKAEITFEDFEKLDLRVGVIRQAENVPKSKKLLHLQVDLGFEVRSVVSGISQYYTPEALIGKKVILVANLKPAKLMGLESRGMVLSGHLDTALELATFHDLPAGATVS